MVEFMIRKHTSSRGDFRGQGLRNPKRFQENESLGSNLVDGPAQRKIPLTGLVLSYSTDRNSMAASKVKKVTIVKEETPGPQRSSESKTLDLNSGTISTHRKVLLHIDWVVLN